LSSKGPKYQRGVLDIFACAIEETFQGKTQREDTKVVLFLHENSPTHRALPTQNDELDNLGFQCQFL
jgi:hypothetical protein